jgi:hypothetical protein
MDSEKIRLIVRQLNSGKYLDAAQHLQDEILRLEVACDAGAKPTSRCRRRIDRLALILEKIGEAASFGDEWDEGVRAKAAAIRQLQKLALSSMPAITSRDAASRGSRGTRN